MEISRTASLNSLPPRLVSRLKALGRKYQEQGVDLFVFGSQAREDCRPNSDLDLGIAWRRPVSRKLFRELCKDVDDLPTIRKVDLVDFASVPPSWKEIAGHDRVLLSSE
jgi:predicted nucleotidyltransferase